MNFCLQLRACCAVLLLVLCAGCQRSLELGVLEEGRGKAWQRYDVVQALASNGEVVVGATQAGAVVISADLGRNWLRRELGPASVIGLAVCPDGSFVGIDFDHKVWGADRRGEHWRSVPLDKPRIPLAVVCDGRGRWWVAGSGAKIAVSAERDERWEVTDLQEDAQLTAIQFVDDKNGFALGEFGHVVATDDGGRIWKKVAQIPGDFYPYAAWFQDARQGWVSGLAGQMLATVDGGRTWNKVENKSGASIYRLFAHEGRPYGVGAGGVVVKLERGVWQPVPYPDALPVFLGAGASLGGGQAALIVGGPGGLVRVIGSGEGVKS